MSHQGRGKHEGHKNKLARYKAQNRKANNKIKKLKKTPTYCSQCLSSSG